MLFVSRLNIKIKPLSSFRLTTRHTAESQKARARHTWQHTAAAGFRWLAVSTATSLLHNVLPEKGKQSC